MARSKSSNRWLEEHINDPYVKKAQIDVVNVERFHFRIFYEILSRINITVKF